MSILSMQRLYKYNVKRRKYCGGPPPGAVAHAQENWTVEGVEGVERRPWCPRKIVEGLPHRMPPRAPDARVACAIQDAGQPTNGAWMLGVQRHYEGAKPPRALGHRRGDEPKRAPLRTLVLLRAPRPLREPVLLRAPRVWYVSRTRRSRGRPFLKALSFADEST